jgi:antitoxin PrlF
MQQRLTSGVPIKEITTTVSQKGQVTIPSEIRRHLGVRTHDKIAFVLQDDGAVRLAVPHYPTIASLAGAAGSLEQALSWAEIKEIAREDQMSSKLGQKP